MEWFWGLPALAASVVAVGVLWRKIIVPAFKLGRAFFRRAKALTAEVEEVRRAVDTVHSIVQGELTTNGGGSALDKINKLVDDAALQAEHLALHDERLQLIGEMFTAHLADAELQHHDLTEQLSAQGINVIPRDPHERWAWINQKSQTDEAEGH